jgi:hypothetical protein
MIERLCRNPQGIPMAEMSPLASVLMMILQKGAWVAAALMPLFAGIVLWQRWTPAGLVLQHGDAGFLGLLAVLFLLAVYIVRSIGKEFRKNSGS